MRAGFVPACSTPRGNYDVHIAIGSSGCAGNGSEEALESGMPTGSPHLVFHTGANVQYQRGTGSDGNVYVLCEYLISS